jgi:small conductance mechanosensitive channel
MSSVMGLLGLHSLQLAAAAAASTAPAAANGGDTSMSGVVNKVGEFLATYGLQIIGAILIFIVGRWIAKLLKGVVRRLMEKTKADPTLVSFVANFTYVVLMVFIILAVLAKIGVQTGSMIAVIGAAGLAVGLALQGSLANFAAGVLLLVFRPFKADDLIEAAGTLGVVEEIGIFVTKLTTPDNKSVIVPNAKLTGDNIVNYSAKPIRRVDLVIGVSYNADLKKTKAVISEVLAADERVLKDPEPTVAVSELGNSSVNLIVRPWTATANYWDVYRGVTQAVKERLDAEGIVIPFPQRDVHLFQEK